MPWQKTKNNQKTNTAQKTTWKLKTGQYEPHQKPKCKEADIVYYGIYFAL